MPYLPVAPHSSLGRFGHEHPGRVGRYGSGVSSEPAEHTRFRDYAHALSHVSDTDESALIAEVLADSDCTMAEAAILGHLDRRAAALGQGEAFQTWTRSLAEVLRGRGLPEQRLREWSLINDIDSRRPWNSADLVEASDRLQRHVADHTASQEALTVLTDRGRTKRIRNAANARLNRRPG